MLPVVSAPLLAILSMLTLPVCTQVGGVCGVMFARITYRGRRKSHNISFIILVLYTLVWPFGNHTLPHNSVILIIRKNALKRMENYCLI